MTIIALSALLHPYVVNDFFKTVDAIFINNKSSFTNNETTTKKNKQLMQPYPLTLLPMYPCSTASFIFSHPKEEEDVYVGA